MAQLSRQPHLVADMELMHLLTLRAEGVDVTGVRLDRHQTVAFAALAIRALAHRALAIRALRGLDRLDANRREGAHREPNAQRAANRARAGAAHAVL